MNAIIEKIKDLILSDTSELEKAVVGRNIENRFFAIKDSNVVDLGYSLPSDVQHGSHDDVGRYALIIRRGYYSDFNIEVRVLDKEVDTMEAQSIALDLLDNNKNEIKEVDVAVAEPMLFAGRPVYRGFVFYTYLSKEESEGIDGLDVVECIEKQGSQLQSILFPKDKFSVEQAKTWLKSHKKHSGKVDTTENYHRFRQFDPGECSTTPKTMSLGSGGIKAVVCVKKAEEETQTQKTDKTEKSSLVHDVIIKDYNLEKGLVYGIVYSPNMKDSHGDWTSAEEIEKAAHSFLPDAMMNLDHKVDLEKSDAHVVESYIKQCNCPVNGEAVSKGSWVLVSKVTSEELKNSIIDGERTGYSLEGHALKVGE